MRRGSALLFDRGYKSESSGELCRVMALSREAGKENREQHSELERSHLCGLGVSLPAGGSHPSAEARPGPTLVRRPKHLGC